jgi:hypothetical protein
MRLGVISILFIPAFIVLLFTSPAVAQSDGPFSAAALASAVVLEAQAPAQPTAPPPVAVEYSDGYRLRAKIHKVSSFATLPLFSAEAIIGQSLYSDPTSGKKDAHLITAAGIGTLFAVNTVTGVWNLIEARKDPVHRGRRLAHGLMMLGADVGFVATAALGPESEDGGVEGSRGAHRAMAFTSIALATTSYLIMLFGGK